MQGDSRWARAFLTAALFFLNFLSRLPVAEAQGNAIDETNAGRELRWVCDPRNWKPVPPAKKAASSSRRCRLARELTAKARDITSEIQNCLSGNFTCGVSQKIAVDQKIRHLMDQYLLSYFLRYKASLSLFEIIDRAQASIQRSSEGDIQAGLGGLKEIIARLDRRLGRIEISARASPNRQALTEIGRIDEQGGLAYHDFLGISFLIDANNDFIEGKSPQDKASYRAALAERQKANNLARSLVGIRARLIALQKRWGIRTFLPLTSQRVDKDSRAIEQDAETVGALRKNHVSHIRIKSIHPNWKGASLGLNGAAALGKLGSAPKPKLIPSMSLPWMTKISASPRVPPSPPRRRLVHMSGPGSYDQFPRYAAFLHWMDHYHFSRIKGHPRADAAFVHRQRSGDCAIVSQQEVLEIMGQLPFRRPWQTENRLIREAQNKGLAIENGNTLPAYAGELLTSRGVLIAKHYYSQETKSSVIDSDLDSVLKRGHLAIVAVDAGVLWNDKKYLNGGHVVLVTGVSVLPLSGKVMGYYINDSGVSPASRGRLVSAAQFREAVNSRVGRNFVEVMP